MARRSDYAKRKGRGKSPTFVMLPHYVLKCEAYRSLSLAARCLYVELKCVYNGSNNGSIGLGVRAAGELLGVSRSSASRAFIELQDRGFIRVATRSTFHQKRLSQEWLLTELRDDRGGEIPTKEFLRWKPTLPAE